jgi:hypothetical protein
LEQQVTFGNFFEYVATEGHPAGVPWWAHVIAWPVIIVAFVLARPNNG